MDPVMQKMIAIKMIAIMSHRQGYHGGGTLASSIILVLDLWQRVAAAIIACAQKTRRGTP
jgi:hypothetical protein